MLGTVEGIDYDGDRVLKVVLRFPPTRADSSEDTVKVITTCERVGQGTFGTVYRALCDGYANLALKISTGKATRLRQELEVLSKTCTQGKLLLPRFEFGAINKSCDLVVIGMELCVPRTLHDFLISEKISSEADKLFLAYQATQAVSYVHEMGCIHRDIKLQNYVFDLHGNLKLIDFGLACNSLRPPPGDVVAGTVSFMAPEMAHNALHKDRRVSVGAPGDIWSLGIVLFSIFTQRNPYPSQPTVDGSDDDEGNDDNGDGAKVDGTTGGRALVRSTTASQVSQSTRQRLTNERLLRRVADADWRWPEGCSASAELRALVEGILVKDAARRPTIAEILSKKIWNLRRRAPPEQLEVFLGVADDFFLSRDETHLLRAVEERSAGVAASLIASRLHSTDGDGLEERTRDGDGAEASGSTLSLRRATGGGGGAAATTTTSPVRPNGSLRVVTRAEAAGDGGPEVQVYDIRASARRNSRPIRAISQVIAEETAKTAAAAEEVPAKARSLGARSRSRVGEGGRGKRRSPTASPAGSRASSLSSHRSRRRGKVATGATTQAASDDPLLDADAEAASDAGANMFDSRGDAGGPSVVTNLRSSFDAAQATGCTAEAVAPGQPRTTKRRAGSVAIAGEAADGTDSDLIADSRDPSEGEDEEDEGVPQRRQRRPRPEQRASSRQPPQKRPRDAALQIPSSALLLEDLTTANGRLVSTSRPRAGSGRSDRRGASGSRSQPRPRTVAPPTLAPPPTVGTRHGAHTPTPPRPRSPVAAPARDRLGARPPVAPAASASTLSFVQREAARRALLSSTLLVEHAWLLASFRLTIEEDQERYSITWLGEEQAKSAAHPHKFKEVFQVPGKKYQYGFVCDSCDYEFLPGGRGGRQLHFYHCPCGRDLCPECYGTYERQCTCACCGIRHTNSCALRDHLQGIGGRGGHRAAAAAAAKRPRTRGAREAPEPAAPLSRRGPRATAATAVAGAAAAGSPSMTAASAAMRVSVAAMHQREVDTGYDDVVVAAPGPARAGVGAGRARKASAGRMDAPIDALPEGPWRPFAKTASAAAAAAGLPPLQLPTPEEREVILNGEWVRHFYLYPSGDGVGGRGAALEPGEEPFAFAYHIQPGRTGAVFLTSEFPMHSAVFALLERQFFIVDQVNTLADDDLTRVTTLVKAKSTPGLSEAYQALQEIVSYDTNLAKQRRAPGTVSVYQAPRSAYASHGDPYVFVRWFRFNEDRSLSAFLLSNGGVQVFVNNEFELRWFDENRKFLVRCNGVCEIVGDSTFALAPAINQLLYGSFDT